MSTLKFSLQDTDTQEEMSIVSTLRRLFLYLRVLKEPPIFTIQYFPTVTESQSVYKAMRIQIPSLTSMNSQFSGEKGTQLNKVGKNKSSGKRRFEKQHILKLIVTHFLKALSCFSKHNTW